MTHLKGPEATLLCRKPTDFEQALRRLVERQNPLWTQAGFPRSLWQDLPSPEPLFGAVMSLVEVPPSSRPARARCQALLASSEFLPYLSRPASFSREQLTVICRNLMQIDPGLDVQLASSLCAHSCGEAHAAEALHVLAALDEISRGGRLAMALTRLTRSASAHVASKAVLMLGRRVSNPAWIERQMAADDARIRANVIESLWGLASELARKSFRTSLQDVHNRVVGNALIGLHLLGEQDVGERLTEMINHPNPSFRATAAWAMGRRGDPVHADSLRLALDDPDPGVRKRAALSLATIEATAPG